MISGVLLATMVAVGVWLKPRPPRARRIAGEAERSWMRAVDAAYERGRQDGLERVERPHQVLRIVRRDERGWMGTTRAQGGTTPNGKGAA
jgi:hypothetical protein